MSEVFATFVIAQADVVAARALASTFPGGDNMFVTKLSEDGEEPATHFISSGFVDADLAAAIPNTDETPESVLQAMNLKFVIEWD